MAKAEHVEAEQHHDDHDDHHEPQGIWQKYIFSQDHKIIAIQYTLTAIFVGLIGLGLSGVMRLQLGFPGDFGITDAFYFQAITMHGMIMVVYLLTALLLGGFGNYLIPLMLGARDMAFPYLNMLSYWFYFVSVVVLLASFFVPGGPTGAGWTLYPPQSILPNTPGADGLGIVLMIGSLAIFIVAATMGGLNYVVTVLQLRAKGMTLMRMPLSIWGIFTASILALLAFPALFVGAVMMMFDNLLGTSFFMPAIVDAAGNLVSASPDKPAYSGGSPLLFQHLFWYFGHPEVYIVALPAFGVISDVLATHARKTIFGYHMMVWAILAIGVISFVVWAHHMFVSGMNPYFGFFFASTTLVIAIPTAIKVYNWIFTLWRGNIRLNTPMLWCIGFISTFLIGGLTGLWLGNVIVDIPLSDTYFVIAHFHLVMGVSAVFAIFAGLYHWFPKVTGRHLNKIMSRTHFWVTFVGVYVVFLPMHYLGFEGMPRRYPSYGEDFNFPASATDLNAFITIAAIIMGIVQFVFIFNMAWSAFKGKKAEGNPWESTTLEWQTPDTPPVHGNWGPSLPVVHRWAYDYSVPGANKDYLTQDTAPSATAPRSDRHLDDHGTHNNGHED